ncbi:MAG: tRNA (adenosine(37)-N6)-dimethylallyltransferase MiaA [Clostridia bacterium]|nr:tRNA (adenosine(37)-N6)-dimethylallyltransferase MiaA [Clostridia bacterium]
MKNTFVAVLGATASGKSALALALASKYNGEIVSCDSMQVYRKMDIGTAKPTAEERLAVPHHMIDTVGPDEEFSAGDYSELAGKAIEDIFGRGKLPIVCGGTFLYLDSLTEVSSYSESSKDGALREKLAKFASEHGAAALHARLEAVDPESAAAIHENNVKRVIRAIEIFETTGTPKSVWDKRSKESEPRFGCVRLAILYHDRDLLYRRIDARVDRMMEEGLLGEAKSLYEAGYLSPDKIASQAIGYKEFIGYFEGALTLEEATESIKQSTRNYAKRQLTWLRRYKDLRVVWGDSEDGRLRGAPDILCDATALLEESGIKPDGEK